MKLRYLFLISVALYFQTSYSISQSSMVNFGLPGETFSASDGVVNDQGEHIVYFTKVINSMDYYSCIAKLSPYHAVEWAYKIGHTSSGNNGHLFALPNNEYLVYVNGDPTLGNSPTITKFNDNGAILWQKYMDPGTDLKGLAPMSDGTIYTMTRANYPGIIKFDPNGNILWAKKFIIQGGVPQPSIIRKTNDDKLLVLTSAYIPLTSSYQNSLMKLDTSANIVWHTSPNWDGTTIEGLRDIFISTSNDIYFLGNKGLSPNMDLMIRKLDSTGNPISAKWIGGVYDEMYLDIEELSNGDLAIMALTKPTQICGGNNLFLKINQNMDTISTHVYGDGPATGNIFNKMYQKFNEIYAFGAGSALSTIGYDGHITRCGYDFSLPCHGYNQSYTFGSLPNLVLASPLSVSFMNELPNMYNYTLDSTLSMITQDICTGAVLDVSESDQIEFKCYPNPVEQTLKVELSNALVDEINIYNNVGELIQRDTGTSIDFTNFASGIYMLEAKCNEGVYYQRVVKP